MFKLVLSYYEVVCSFYSTVTHNNIDLDHDEETLHNSIVMENCNVCCCQHTIQEKYECCMHWINKHLKPMRK